MPRWRIGGNGGFENIEAQVDPLHQALRTSIRPSEPGVFGSYRKTLKSGVIGAGIAGSSPVWEFRWGQMDPMVIIRSFRVQAVVSTTAFNATAADSSLSLYRVQGFSAMDGTGGTFAAFTKGKAGALATRFPNTQLALDSSTNRVNQGGIVIANTGALSAGTYVKDDDPIAVVQNRIIASAAAETIITPEPAPYMVDPAATPALQPLEIAGNEGLILVADAITATGTWRLSVEVVWDEVDPTIYFRK